MTSFSDVFRHAGKQDRSRIRVPDEIMQAWIYVLMGLIFMHTDTVKSSNLLEDAKSLLDEGLGEMVMAMSDRTLLEQAIVQPMELVSLMSAQLMQNPTPNLPSAADTYSSYLFIIASPPPPVLPHLLLVAANTIINSERGD